MPRSKIFIHTTVIAFIFTGIFAFCSDSDAQDNNTRVRVDEATIEKGYTVIHDRGGIRFAVTPGQVDQEVTAVLKDKEINTATLPSDKGIASKAYSFDMVGQEHNPIVTTRPSWIAIKYTTSSYIEKAIYHWDNNRKSWIELPSTMDTVNKYVKAITHLPYSQVVVLEKAEPQAEYSGIASWYESGQTMTAAMNKFNIGDTVRVTNTANDKTCTVEIIDRGPYSPGRIIDLSDDAFEVLAPLSLGLIDVKVEKF